MTEFVTLRPKMYAYKTGESESKKCKGIKKCVVKKTISFKDYKRDRETQRQTQREIVKGGFWRSSGMVFVIIAIMLSGYTYGKRAPSMSL